MKTAVAALAFVLVTNSAGAEGMPESIRKTLEEHLIGKWNTTVTSDGQTLKGTYVATWAADQNCIMVEHELTGPGGERRSNAGVVGWLPESNSIVHHVFSSDGDHATLTWSEFGENEWKGKITGLSDGEKRESPASVTLGQDSFNYQDTFSGKPTVIEAVRQESD